VKVTAPPGYRVNPAEVHVTWQNQQGSENWYKVGYGDWIQPFSQAPDIKAPKTVGVMVHARSSRGSCAGRGVSEVHVWGQFYRTGGDQEVPTTPLPGTEPLP
jgi:hypothetical protein